LIQRPALGPVPMSYRMYVRALLPCGLFLAVLAFGAPAAVKKLTLWEGPAPQSHGSAPTDIPRLWLYPASGPGSGPGSAVIICPGGGYEHLTTGDEGANVAEWFQARGVSAFVLVYRLPSDGYRHPVPMLDAQRAIRLVRFHAREWNLDPARIGIMGFSAGGHLASTVETHFDKGDPQATDPVDRLGSRPDFAILVYPVITMTGPLTHGGSRTNLFGPNLDPALLARFSNETQVTAETPPTYLVAAQDDRAVPPENSELFYKALLKNGRDGTLKILAGGGHGFGYKKDQTGPVAGWMDGVGDWMKARHWMP
jgi:acetyl esterase/lipase